MKPNEMQDFVKSAAQAMPRLMIQGDVTDMSAAAAAAYKADRIGLLRSVLAQTQDELDTLRAELEDAGLSEIDGHLYRVSFAECKGSAKTDWKAVATKLQPSRQLIAAHTTVSKGSIRMNVTARTN
jgi:hypothetical protein